MPGMVSDLSPAVQEFLIDEAFNTPSEEAFYVVDIDDIIEKHKNWLINLPRVKPYYAVKCNDSPIVLEILAGLGTGFDCASKAEIDSVLSLKVHPSNIIYANPCKSNSYIQHASAVGVDHMTFDNELELYKIAKHHPMARLVLRIKVDDTGSLCQFSSKFGADLENCDRLLSVAARLGLAVVGVSFHVGSGCQDSRTYRYAIRDSRLVFKMAEKHGHQMGLLDLGGGYPGFKTDSVSFAEIASVINESLDIYFSDIADCVRIIAEPGRYYVASAFTLVTTVIAKRSIADKSFMYYLNDGVYGSFNCTIFDHYCPAPIPLVNHGHGLTEPKDTVLWGPTCDSIDCIKKNFPLPELEIGDHLVFANMGAYTISAATTFNGFQKPTNQYLFDNFAIETLKLVNNWPRIARIIDIEHHQPFTCGKAGFHNNQISWVSVA